MPGLCGRKVFQDSKREVTVVFMMTTLLISTLHGAAVIFFPMACHERILWNNKVSNVGLVNHVY